MGHEIKSGIAGGIIGFLAGIITQKAEVQSDIRQPSYVRSFDIEGKEDCEKCFMLAQANIESAIALCSCFSSGKIPLEWPHASVILSQYYHAYELFYKAAILKKSPVFKSTHRIDQLTDKYNKAYPETKYKLPDAFIFEDLTQSVSKKEKKKAQQARAEHYNKLDQHFRYPFDKPEEPWGIIRGFELNQGFKDLKIVQADFSRIIPLIMGKKVDTS